MLTREALRASFERGGDAQWQILIRHHEDAYPDPKPTPGDVCRGEAERLNQAGYGDSAQYELEASFAERAGKAVTLSHRLRNLRTGETAVTAPFSNYE